jgi:TRAP-type C4-dicarboxylate transport system permease small subunit
MGLLFARLREIVFSRLRLIGILAAIAVFLIALTWFRHFVWRDIQWFGTTVSQSILQAMQKSPPFAHLVHVLFNAVPDISFALLAVAGLSYLMPEIAEKLEARRGVRYILLTLFGLFGFFAILVNAVNRTEQEQKDVTQQHEQVTQLAEQGQVLSSVIDIQKSLHSTNILSEAERREKVSEALRDEYILTHNPIDPEILSGTKMPPEEWMNERLRQMRESWTFKEEPQQVNPPIPEGSKLAHVEFSFYQPDISNGPKTVLLDPLTDGTFTVSIIAVATGDTPAEDLQIWIRECKACEWVSPNPPGFPPADADHQFDRGTQTPELLPNVPSTRWNFTIKVPQFPRMNTVEIGCYYACKNCPTIDWKNPQKLWVTQTMQNELRLLYPPIVYTPEPVKR